MFNLEDGVEGTFCFIYFEVLFTKQRLAIILTEKFPLPVELSGQQGAGHYMSSG